MLPSILVMLHGMSATSLVGMAACVSDTRCCLYRCKSHTRVLIELIKHETGAQSLRRVPPRAPCRVHLHLLLHCCRTMYYAPAAASGPRLAVKIRDAGLRKAHEQVSVCTCGWHVDCGILASLTSRTTSTIFSCSLSCLSAFAICPGYHCTVCT